MVLLPAGEMKARIEPLTAVLRVFSDGRDHGDPYDFACTLRWLDSQTVELLGVDKAPAPSMWRPIVEALREAGAKEFVFTRRGRVRRHKIPVR